VIIDKASGEIKWRWGHGILSMPHNPSLLANGNILVLDNQRFPTKFRPPHGSRLVEVNPTTNEIEWEYSDENPVDFWTCYIGGCERLPNGNTLVCEGAMGRFFEITPEKQLVWEYVVPFYARREGTVYGLSNCTFRCHRYGPDYPGLKGKRLNPAQYDTWNQLYGPGAVASPLRIDSQHPAAEALPVLGQSLGQPKQVDKAAERLKMLGY
jgi:hypothetical protein